jgi:hypothetical protein
MKLDTKTFRYKLGHEAGKTLTVGGLMEALTQFPYDMPVFAQWESCNGFIDVENFSIEKVTKGHEDDECECLVIDVTRY